VRPIFFIGNKRSGTSHVVRLLNAHPNVHVCYEQDLAWILYQCEKGWWPDLVGYKYDTPYGMWGALWRCKNYNHFGGINIANDKHEAIRNAYFKASLALMEDSPSGKFRDAIKWIGDKKPVQNADPEVFDFIRRHFPDAKFIHLIRHVADFAESTNSRIACYKHGPKFWYYERDHLFRMWAIIEGWVLRDKEQAPDCIIDVRYEDLCSSPVEEMERVFSFLDLEMDSRVERIVSETTTPIPKYDRSVSDFGSAREIMRAYSYA